MMCCDRLLIAKGANKDAKNSKGEMPVDVASNQAVREILGADGPGSDLFFPFFFSLF
jgi:hypothetical protein